MKMLHKTAKKDLGVFFDSDAMSFIMKIFYNKPPMLAVEKVWFLIMQAFYAKFSKSVLMLCAIWQHLYNLKNVKNTHGGVLLLVKF